MRLQDVVWETIPDKLVVEHDVVLVCTHAYHSGYPVFDPRSSCLLI